MGPAEKKTPHELAEIYSDQLRMLKARCDAYYKGDFHEAMSIAAIINTLVYDHGRSSISLLTQLGMKKDAHFLDSRSGGNLTLHTAKGVWPRNPMPFREYTVADLYGFKDWWTDQPFHVKFTDFAFTRSELVKAVRNQEGGGHVAPTSNPQLTAIRRSPSRWRSKITEHDDGSATMEVAFHLGNPGELNDEDHGSEIDEYVQASVCAIGEEVLFSLTPEPENRKRMHAPGLRRPLYLTSTQTTKGKASMKSDLAFLRSLSMGRLTHEQQMMVDSCAAQIERALQQDPFTAAHLRVRVTVAEALSTVGLPSPRRGGPHKEPL